MKPFSQEQKDRPLDLKSGCSDLRAQLSRMYLATVPWVLDTLGIYMRPLLRVLFCFPTGSYLYIETSYPRKPGDRALLSLNASGANCLGFWYHMWGVDIGELNVYFNTSQKKFSQLAWHLQGNQGNMWKFAKVSFFGHIAEVGKTLIL